jgi:uncharacterized protein YbjT (DUF2867 family)
MPTPTSKPILITGATGKQGGAVLHQLATHTSSPNFTLLAVTRNASSPAAKKLAGKYGGTVIPVQGDLNDIPALFQSAHAALHAANHPEKIWGVYSVQVSMGTGVTFDGEVKQGCQLIDQSVKEGVKHFVYSSVERGGNDKSWNNETPIPHFQTKHRIEQHLVDKAGKNGEKMGWTILRPVAFMDNLAPGFQTKVFLSALRGSLGDDRKPLQWVSVEDIGRFAANAFREPQKYNARAIGLAGDELTISELSDRFERVTGSPAPITYGVLGGALKWAVKEMGIMIQWFADEGYGVDIKALRKEEPELSDFERWLREKSGWATTEKTED